MNQINVRSETATFAQHLPALMALDLRAAVYLAMGVLILYLLNSFVYFGEQNFWKNIDASGKRLLSAAVAFAVSGGQSGSRAVSRARPDVRSEFCPAARAVGGLVALTQSGEEIMGGCASRRAEFRQTHATYFRHALGGVPRKRRLTALAAMRHGGKERAVGLQHKLIQWRSC